jgi:hypothetical protein
VPVTVLAAGASAASQVEPGVLGFLVVAGIGVALFFLLRSMSKHLKKISPDPRPFAATSDTGKDVLPNGSNQDS